MFYLIFFLFLTNISAGETKITGNEISQPFEIVASTSQTYALTIDNNTNSGDGYVMSVSTNGNLNLQGAFTNRVWSAVLQNNTNYGTTEVTLLALTITTRGGDLVINGKIHDTAPGGGNRNYLFLYRGTTLLDSWIYWEAAPGVINESGVVIHTEKLPAGTYTYYLKAKGESGTRTAIAGDTKLIIYEF